MLDSVAPVLEEQPKVFGAYLLLKALGRGAMGDVWLARPLSPDRGIPAPVVVKRLHGELSNRKGFISRFRHEASIAVNVDSVHVARVYDVGAVGDTLYLAMEYVPGWPLSKVLDAILKSGRHASIASVIDLIAGGLEGLDKLHTAKDLETGKPLGIVHRDISPKNLMVGEDGCMRLIDLGLGKSNAQDWKTRTGVVMGSVGYMPPEQARGEHVDARADLYSLAVVCFEMLALRNYVKRGTLTSMMEASAKPTFMKPSEFRPDVPDGLDSVLERALALDRAARYQTARHFLNALRQVVPHAHTEGGMVALLDELFGATRQEREEEIASLLASPVPDATDAEPTKVFVMREGVLAPDQQPTRFGEPPLVRTAATEMVRRYGANEVPTTLPPDPGAAAHPFASSSYLRAPRQGVSIPVLLAAVLLAAIIGGVVAVLLADRLNTTPHELTAQVAYDPEPLPVPQPKAQAVPEQVPPPAPAEVVDQPVRPARSKRQAPDRDRPPVAAPVSNESLNVELEGMREQAIVLKNGATDSAKKDELNKYLSQVSAWKQSANLEAKQKAIPTLRARLKEFER